MAKQFIERRKDGKTFDYFLNGEKVTDRELKVYFKSLRIPPAWRQVKISYNQKARILATGIDSAGRVQYIYHPAFRARKEKEKFERILRFAQALPRMRRVTAEHLSHRQLDKEKVIACIVRLMDKAYFRVGNEEYAQQNQSYGLTTIRSKHTTVHGDTIVFDFVGKSGQKHLKEITNKKLARIIKKLDDLPGYEVFKYYGEDGELKNIDSEDVNTYIKDVMGEEFSAKDFRTWGGTVLATAELATAGRPSGRRERKKALTACIKNVAKKLGNTPAITRGSYIDPRVINAYVNSDLLSRLRSKVERVKRKSYLSADEHCLLKLLEQ